MTEKIQQAVIVGGSSSISLGAEAAWPGYEGDPAQRCMAQPWRGRPAICRIVHVAHKPAVGL
ncbi:hypothetical protein MES4922_80093 [Mesorhizobium ventifaucium]|uniref:Uncharacterized protein n=1 Tax=Mesorhizobium ventifaucium TaxID=666020 RepID=A0ABM9EEJ2_9HYPH|nr:hypothetical protein MES4922_80093 [Mesorhizobium ventifaucium]